MSNLPSKILLRLTIAITLTGCAMEDLARQAANNSKSAAVSSQKILDVNDRFYNNARKTSRDTRTSEFVNLTRNNPDFYHAKQKGVESIKSLYGAIVKDKKALDAGITEFEKAKAIAEKAKADADKAKTEADEARAAADKAKAENAANAEELAKKAAGLESTATQLGNIAVTRGNDAAYFGGKAQELGKTAQATRDANVPQMVGIAGELMKMENQVLFDKANSAGAYLSSFEFHFWSAGISASDSPQRRLQLFEEALHDFFSKVGSIVTSKLTNISDQADLTLDALSVVLDSTLSDEADLMKSMKVKPTVILKDENIQLPEVVSMYDLLNVGLQAANAVEAGKARFEDLPKFVSTVAENRDTATMLLTNRYNVQVKALIGAILPTEVTSTSIRAQLAAMYLGKLGEEAGLGKIPGTSAAEVKFGQIQWAPDAAVLGTTAGIESAREKAENALKTQTDLSKAAAVVVLDQPVRVLLLTAKADEVPAPDQPTPVKIARVKKVNGLMVQLKALQAANSSN